MINTIGLKAVALSLSCLLLIGYVFTLSPIAVEDTVWGLYRRRAIAEGLQGQEP